MVATIRIVAEKDWRDQPRDPGGEGGGQWVKRGAGGGTITVTGRGDKPTPGALSLTKIPGKDEEALTPFQKRARKVVQWFNDHPIATNLLIAGLSVAAVLIAGKLVNKADPDAIDDPPLPGRDKGGKLSWHPDEVQPKGKPERSTPEGGISFPKDSSYWGFNTPREGGDYYKGQTYFSDRKNAPSPPSTEKGVAKPKVDPNRGFKPGDSIDLSGTKKPDSVRVDEPLMKEKWKEALRKYDDDAWDDHDIEGDTREVFDDEVSPQAERIADMILGQSTPQERSKQRQQEAASLGLTEEDIRMSDALDQMDENADKAIKKRQERRKKAKAKEEKGTYTEAEVEEMFLLDGLMEETGTNSPHDALGLVNHVLDGNPIDDEVIEFNDLDYLDDGFFDEDIAGKSTVVIKYDPNQPRDPGGENGGQWIRVVAGGAGGPMSAPTFEDLSTDSPRAEKAKEILLDSLDEIESKGYDLPDNIVMGNPIRIRDKIATGLTGGVIGGLPGAFFGPTGALIGFGLGFALGYWSEHEMSKGIMAAWEMNGEKLYFNTDADYWDNPEKAQKEIYDSGWLSSPDPHHVVYHELAHKLHQDLKPDDQSVWDFFEETGIELTPEEEAIAKKVSGYATTMRGEFIAEVFAGHMAGVKFPKDVLKQYREFGGPKLK